MTQIYISEIFGPTIQGEGVLIGKPTVFVRVGGCDYRCEWCDSLYAVEAKYRSTWQLMDVQTIFSKIKKLTNNKPILVTLSGGNPAIFDFTDLINLGHAEGFRFAMETQGSLVKDYFSKLDYLTLSPKAPSAKVAFDQAQLSKAIASHHAPTLKIVVANEKDYQFAKMLHETYTNVAMVLQPCNPCVNDDKVDIDRLNDQLKWLIERTKTDAWYDVTLLPQLHVMLWHNERGV